VYLPLSANLEVRDSPERACINNPKSQSISFMIYRH